MTQLKSFFDIVNELSMKSDKKLPNLKVPVKGKRGVSKFMRKKAITKAKDDLNAGFKTDANRKAAFAKMNDAVQSADRKPEKYIKPDGKVGIRMVKTDKEVIKKESSFGDNSLADKLMRMRFQAAASQKKNQKKTDDAEKKKMAAKADMDMRARKESVEETQNEISSYRLGGYLKFAKKDKKKDRTKGMNMAVRKGLGSPGIKKPSTSESVDEAVRNLSAADQVKAAIKIIRDKRFNDKFQIDKKTAIQKISKDLLKDPKVKKEIDKIYEETVDEALTLQQRMKRGRLMKRLKARIKIGRDRARRKMANKKTLEKRSMRQARNQLAKKLTRGIPKRELTFARKQEIEKRLDKPALKARIQRIAKRIFKDVRKKEVQRKKG